MQQQQTEIPAVFVLQHVNEPPTGGEDLKLIGIYSSNALAEAARERLSSKPGFSNAVDGFLIDRYEVDKDHWAEGYATVAP